MEMYPAERGLGTPMRLHIYNESLHGLLTEAPHSSIKVDDAGRLPLSPELESATERVVVLAQRYVLGLLIMMQSHPNFGGPKERPVPPTSKRRDGPPKHRTFMLGRPIDVDCRAAIREYVEGRRRGAPSVQTLVIGHHKRQVIGVGRTGRKLNLGAALLARARRCADPRATASHRERRAERSRQVAAAMARDGRRRAPSCLRVRAAMAMAAMIQGLVHGGKSAVGYHLDACWTFMGVDW